MFRHNIGTVLVAAAVTVLLLVAFVLARAQDKLPELGLDLLVYLFATTLAVFVIGRILAWRERRRWVVAIDWLHMILLETIDDLLRVLLPAAVPREGVETEEEVTVYKVAGERVHFGETVAFSPLQLLVNPGEKDLQSHIFWYATEVGPQRYVELAREALSDARLQIRDTFGSSARLMDADITTMLISFEQAAMAARRHLDSAVNLRNEKVEAGSHRDSEAPATQLTREADRELAFVSSIIVESVVDSAMKPKAWLEDQRLTREGPSSPFRRLQASGRAGPKKRT